MSINSKNNEEFPETDLTKLPNLEEIKESEANFKSRNNTPVREKNDFEIEYAKKIQSSYPVSNPTSFEDLMKNMSSLKYGVKVQRKQLISFEDAKKLFIVASDRLTGGKFQVNDFNRDILTNMIKWFIGDETCIYDLKKGICLIGYIGTGKTKVFEIFRLMMDSFYNDQLKFKIKACKDIANETKDAIDLKKYYGGVIMFDDLGMEVNDVKSYGNSVGVMSDIIFQREVSHELNGLITHFTTNLKDEKLSQKYGDRIYDRLQKICNMVYIEQNFSWRTKQ